MEQLGDLDLKELKEVWDSVTEAWKDEDYGRVIAGLMVVGDKVGQISPVVAPVIF